MENKVGQNKEFCTLWTGNFPQPSPCVMQNPKSISELFQTRGARLGALGAKSRQRRSVLEQVRAALPAKLAEKVMTAGIDNARLTIGVAGAQWATRLRYMAGSVCSEVGEALEVDIRTLRVRVIPLA